MMTVEELNRVEHIKSRVFCVTAEEKQFILNLAAREQIPVPTEAFIAAKQQGYDVQNVLHNALTA